jgi:hypothetical protein
MVGCGVGGDGLLLGEYAVVVLLRSTTSWPAHGGLRCGRRWLVVGWWFSEPTLPRLSVGEGFGRRWSFPQGVRRWRVGVSGFDRHRIPASGSFPRPKCSGGPPAGCAVAVAAVAGCFHHQRPHMMVWASPVCVSASASRAGCHNSRGVRRWSGRGESKCSPLTLPVTATWVVVHCVLCRWGGSGRSFGRKSFPTLVSGSATAAFSDVVDLNGGVGWEAPCLVFVFPGENLSPAIGGATTAAASTSFTSCRRRLGNQVISFYFGGTFWWAVGGLFGTWMENKSEA